MAFVEQGRATNRSRALLLFWFHPTLFAYNVAGAALLFLLWTVGSGPFNWLNPVVALITSLLLIGGLELLIGFAGRRTQRPSGIVGYIAAAYVLFHAFRTTAILLLFGVLELVLLMGAVSQVSYHPVVHPPTVVIAVVYALWATLHLARRRLQSSRLAPPSLPAGANHSIEAVNSTEIQ